MNVQEDTFSKETIKSLWEEIFNFKSNSNGESYNHQIRAMRDLQEDSPAVEIEYKSLDEVDEKSDFGFYCGEYPEIALNIGRQALAEITGYEEAELRIVGVPLDFTVQIRKLRGKHIGKMIAVEGMVKRASEVRPRIVAAEFACRTCGMKQTILQPSDEDLEYPTLCDVDDGGCGERKRFKILPGKSKTVDCQDIEIIELPETMRGGQQPERLECVAIGSLTGDRHRISPGDRVRLIGLVNALPAKKNSQIFVHRLDIISAEFIEHGFDDIVLTDEDIAEILIASQDEHIIEQLSLSIAPSIYGYETIKEAFCLQMFSGQTVTLPDGTKTRGHIHIFLIGDPGVAKTQLLIAVQEAHPRGVFATGGQTSGVGLTAAAVKDTATGRWTLEGGALVFADGGVACIDEIDKMMPVDKAAMHEAMESGKVTVTKAGINATLPTRCSIAGGANPKLGRFNRTLPVAQQVDMSPPLLSRFDLIFAMTDIPEEKKDLAISNTIINKRTGVVAHSPYSTEFLTKYVAYARGRTDPLSYTDEAKQFIQGFYVNMRKKSNPDAGTISITPRQVEGICRLSEASARARLANAVTLDDAKRAVRLTEYYLKSMAMEDGTYDIDKATSGITGKKRGRLDVLRTLIITHPEGLKFGAIEKEMNLQDPFELEELLDSLMDKERSVFVTKDGLYKPVN